MKHTMMNYSMLLEIYHHLQCQSSMYPWIDTKTLRERFIDLLGLDQSIMQKINDIIGRLEYTEHWEDKAESS